MIKARILTNLPDLDHYFLIPDDLKFCRYRNITEASYKVEQIHKAGIIKVKKNIKYYKDYDGLLSGENLSLGIKTADCLPVLFYAPGVHIIGACHAGWKGLLKGILGNMVSAMTENGAQVNKIIVAIGPHIRKCCYEVKKDFINLFRKKSDKRDKYIKKIKNKYFFDLEAFAFFMLLSAGIKKQNIEIIKICTKCNINYPSFRRDGIKSERIWSIIKQK